MQKPTVSEKRTASGGAESSIIEILEVIESDFARNFAEEKTEKEDGLQTMQKRTENKVRKRKNYNSLKLSKAFSTISHNNV